MYQFIFSKKFKWFCFIIWICHKISEVSIASHNPHIGCVRNARTCSPFSLQPQPTACVPCSAHLTDGFKGRLKKRSRRLFHLPCDKASRSPHVGCVRYARTRSLFYLQPQPTARVPCGTHPTDGFKGCLNSPCFEGYLKIGQSLFSSAETRPCSARHSFQVAFLRCLAGNQAYGKVGFAALVFKKADVVAVDLAAGADGPGFAHLHAAVHFLRVVDFAVY